MVVLFSTDPPKVAHSPETSANKKTSDECFTQIKAHSQNSLGTIKA